MSARPELAARNRLWVEMYRAGATLAEIGAQYGVCRDRVRQVMVEQGVTKRDGGFAIGGGPKAARDREARARNAERDRTKAAARAKRERERLDRTGMPVGVALHKQSGLYFAQAFSKRLPGYHRTIEAAAAQREAALNKADNPPEPRP